MKKQVLQSMSWILLVILISLFVSCTTPTVTYLDNNFPGLKAELYAENLINDSNKLVQSFAMNSDGTEQYFCQATSDFYYERILRIRVDNETTLLDTLVFDTTFVALGEPKLSFDDKHLYFAGAVNFPYKIWRATRNSTNEWINPERIDLPVDYSKYATFYPSFSTDGYMYFCTWNGGESITGTGKMQKAKRNKIGEYEMQEVDVPGHGTDPCIARDGSYLIVNSRMDQHYSQNYGMFDLYVCFKLEDGTWSKAINMGPEINTEAIDMHAFVSPDEKYLFFSRRESFSNATYSKIYWISTEIIDEIRKENNL